MKQVVIYGNSSLPLSNKPIECFKKEVIKAEKKSYIDVSDDFKGFDSLVDISWLPSASKKYNISPNIEDYIIEFVPVVTATIPNRNMQTFLLQDLIEFDINLRRPRYKTFVGTPTFVNHDNKDVTKAKGVNLDATLLPVKKYGVVKICVLSAFDRTKDPNLTKTILRNKQNTYSMGALGNYFVCSICNGVLGYGVRRTCTCDWSDFTNLASYGRVINGKLHYLIAKEFYFIENSYVENPADITAIGVHI